MYADEAFNQCTQVHLNVVYIIIKRFEVFNSVDTLRKYCERTIAPDRSIETMRTLLDTYLLCYDGAPNVS